MPVFSERSRQMLVTCHPDLRLVFEEVLRHWDCTVLEGQRSRQQQAENVRRGVSQTMESRHLVEYSERPELGVDAVDAAPAPLRWPQRPKDHSPAERTRWMKDMARFYFFGGFVLGVASQLGVALRYGGDWDGDREIHEQRFDDLVHFERLR